METEPLPKNLYEVPRPFMSTRDEILYRLEDISLFHTQKDREIAGKILTQLDSRLAGHLIDRKVYEKALTGLNLLIPKRNERGFRTIADIIITPPMEETIRSRLESEEVNIMGQDGSWGSLPAEVQAEIVKRSHVGIEMTDHCTVRCSFCGLSEKGSIKKKIALHSLEELLRYMRDNRPTRKWDRVIFYWGTDPFDAKWRAADGKDYDYTDVADLYRTFMTGKAEYFFTSTALPIGEELRVLHFADIELTRKKAKKIRSRPFLRISATEANKTRAGAIRNILTALHNNAISKNDVFDTGNISISSRSNKEIVLAGKRWQKNNIRVSLWDIMNVSCGDCIIVSVRSTDGTIMEASSNERPIGQSRFPVRAVDSTGLRIYTVPHLQDETIYSHPLHINAIYPDAIVTEFAVRDGNSKRTKKIIDNNPHRAFLRMIGVLECLAWRDGNEPDDISRRNKKIFRRKMAKEITLVQNYMKSGAHNVSMERWMTYLKRKHFIQ